jgi:hypothetical protein
MEVTLDAQIRGTTAINHHPANAITQSHNHACSVLKNQPMFIAFRTDFERLVVPACDHLSWFVRVTTGDRNRLFVRVTTGDRNRLFVRVTTGDRNRLFVRVTTGDRNRLFPVCLQ